ncbi:MAG: transposase, partial [Coriobacteriales bacterium]|nr:transposase [Coriobacteriaceae bacterium]MDY2722494.1 transposase [Coriobacteriales bacterium]
DYLVAGATRDKNRLRSILLESCPAFESLVDLSDPHCLRMLSEIGGPWQVLDAGKSSVGAVTRGANRARIDALWESISTSTRPDGLRAAAEGASVRLLAKRVSEAASECARLEAEISALLESDATYRCLLTVPGIGPRTASELVIGIDIGEFASHDRLASYCGLAPRNRRSGTSVSSVTASRRGNKRLKNLLVFSCNSLIRSDNRFGAFYRKCRDRGMPHGKALKAVARKRLKVIYAIMRDRVPYAA